MNKQLPLFTK